MIAQVVVLFNSVWTVYRLIEQGFFVLKQNMSSE